MTDLVNIFDGEWLNGYVDSVYDGDTCKIFTTIPDTDKYVRIACRINGYDSPEMRTSDANEKQIAIIARDQLRTMILHKNVRLKTSGCDKYGRFLVDITIGGLNISEYMISNNLGISYNGGTKIKPKYNEDLSYEIDGTKFIVKT